MNFKHKKSKRSVKCTMCTKYRWMGNTKDKQRISDQRMKQEKLHDQ